MVQVKTCTKCKGKKPITEFSKNRGKSKDDLHPWCKTCLHERGAAAYAYGEAFAYKYLGAKCTYPGCAQDDWDMLQCHHVGQRDHGITHLYDATVARLIAELNKCVLLCSNHHSKTHALQKRAANEAQYQKFQVIPFPAKYRSVKAPSRSRGINSPERPRELRSGAACR